MIRTLIVAGAAALALGTFAGTGVALAADETGPGTSACTQAGIAVSTAQKSVDDAQKALDAVPAAEQTAEQKTALANAKTILAAKRADQTKACGKPSETTRPNPPRHNDGRDHDWDRHNNRTRDGVIVTDDGRCVTFREENRNYGTRYNNRVNDLRDRARDERSEGGTRVTPAEWDRIQNAQDVRDYRNRWSNSRNELRTICNDPTPEVTIIEKESDEAPAPFTTIPAAPSTGSGGSSSVIIPKKAPETGVA